MNPLELRTVQVGFVLAGLVIAVTGVSYLLNMEFQYQWLVWIIGVAFVAVGLITVEWLRAVRGAPGDEPGGGLRMFLLLAMPLSYIIDSQICGLGLKACNTACHILSYALLLLAAVVAIQLYRGKSIVPFLIPTVILSVVPHCGCHAPINIIWHSHLFCYAVGCGPFFLDSLKRFSDSPLHHSCCIDVDRDHLLCCGQCASWLSLAGMCSIIM
jgi:hypothetical protein